MAREGQGYPYCRHDTMLYIYIYIYIHYPENLNVHSWMIFCPGGIIPDSGLTGLNNTYIHKHVRWKTTDCFLFKLTATNNLTLTPTDDQRNGRSPWEVQKNIACSFQQILEAAPHKASVVRPSPSHLTNHPSKANKNWGIKDKLISEVLQWTATPEHIHSVRTLCAV